MNAKPTYTNDWPRMLALLKDWRCLSTVANACCDLGDYQAHIELSRLILKVEKMVDLQSQNRNTQTST